VASSAAWEDQPVEEASRMTAANPDVEQLIEQATQGDRAARQHLLVLHGHGQQQLAGR
jgi:hypothetical protein